MKIKKHWTVLTAGALWKSSGQIPMEGSKKEGVVDLENLVQHDYAFLSDESKETERSRLLHVQTSPCFN